MAAGAGNGCSSCNCALSSAFICVATSATPAFSESADGKGLITRSPSEAGRGDENGAVGAGSVVGAGSTGAIGAAGATGAIGSTGAVATYGAGGV